jgi:hypothetical protein
MIPRFEKVCEWDVGLLSGWVQKQNSPVRVWGCQVVVKEDCNSRNNNFAHIQPGLIKQCQSFKISF